jgi:ribosomal protein S18 acetylase RimI-like enzyme
MTQQEMIELSDLNLAEAYREMSRRAGGVAHDEDGLCYWVGGHLLPVLCNGVLPTRSGLAAADVFERARAFFAARQRGYTVMLRAHADADLIAATHAAELTEWGASPAMVLEARLADAVAPAGVRVERVESEDDARAYAAVMAAAYATYGMPADVAPAVLSLDVLRAPHIVAFLVRLDDGTPAAGAMVLVTHGVAGIYWVGTTPEARGRGLAELATRAAGNAGFDLGARMAALQASQMGEPVYRRMGYVTVTRYPTFVRF